MTADSIIQASILRTHVPTLGLIKLKKMVERINENY